jgi:hypothetical protein
MPAYNIRSLLGASNEFKALRDKTQHLRALQQAYVGSTPAELAEASRVGYVRASTLWIFADNSAVASKLRQMLPRVLPVIQKLEPEITGIQIQVQAEKGEISPSHHAKKETLSLDNIELIEILAKSVPDPDLKSALTQFAARNRKSR